MRRSIWPSHLGAQALANGLWRQLAAGSSKRSILGGPCRRGAGLTRPHRLARGAVFIWRDGRLWRRAAYGDRLCIPDDVGMRRTVLEELHAAPLGGHFGRERTLALARRSVHPGRERTLALARRSVWWPSLPGDVAAFVRACPTCQRVYEQ